MREEIESWLDYTDDATHAEFWEGLLDLLENHFNVVFTFYEPKWVNELEGWASGENLFFAVDIDNSSLRVSADGFSIELCVAKSYTGVIEEIREEIIKQHEETLKKVELQQQTLERLNWSI